MNREVRNQLDPIRHVSALGFFSQRPVEAALKHGDSLALIGTSDERWAYLVVTEETSLEGLLTKVWEEEGIRAFATVEDWVVPGLRRLGTLGSALSCIRYVLHSDTPVRSHSGFRIRPLRAADARTICAHSDYYEYISEAYIEEVIEKGFSGGIESEGGLVAWATTHDDLAIGNLHVLPHHRRRGYAAALVSHLADRVRRLGHLPVMNIEPSNRASRAMAERLGFIEDRPVSWLKFIS
ncbi:MAG: GNAT family N-acetyltransferase [Spirochaetaceae bacterium]